MLGRLALSIVALQAGLAAAGNAIVSNRCPYDIWIWSVNQGSDSGPIHVPSRTQYSEPVRSSCSGCGTSIKVSKSEQLSGGSQTQFEYSIVGGNQMWYDISFVDCASGNSADKCPGHDLGLTMNSPNQACGVAQCSGGSYCPDQAYYVDYPMAKLGMQDPVFGCPNAGADMDLNMIVCSDESSLKRSIAGRTTMDLEN